MTIEEIRNRVKEIKQYASSKVDDEMAHFLEDELLKDFVKHLCAVTDKSLAAKAKAVLKAFDIEFCRWCA
jgi:hypothetical protein